jgi:hypothetical protein
MRADRSSPRSAAACGALLLALLAVLNPAAAQDPAKPCDVARVKTELADTSVPMFAALAQAAFSSTRCSAALAVIKLVGSAPRTGGRKLEEGAGFNAEAAASQRNLAATDPAFAAALAQELQGETDPHRRLLREAALLHDHGHYAARDLLVRQLRAGSAR